MFIKKLFWKFVNGDIWWGRLRLFLVFVVVDLSAVAMAYIFETMNWMRIWHNIVLPTIILAVALIVYMRIVRDVMESDKTGSRVFNHLFFFVLFFGMFLWFESKLVARVGLVGQFLGYYLIAPLAAVVIAVFTVAKYVQDIYDLESYSLGLLYIMSSFGGIAYPKLTIDDAQYQMEPGKVNRLDLIGGPGNFTVKPGTAVILNDIGIHSKVVSSNKVFLSHYGSIVDKVDLNNQRKSVSSVSATTKDGITITIQNIEMRYRIWFPSHLINNNTESIQSNPYPYDEQSVRDSVYNLSVNEDGLTQWSESVKNIVVAQIASYITERQFDEIVTPTFQKHEPRQEIRKELFSSATEKKLKDIGAKLLWCDIGHFETDKAVHDQRLETWSAKWVGNANVVRSRGEAKRVAYQELGRAEAQADILMSIIHAFDDIDLSIERKNENIRNVVLMRSAQVLESLTSTKASELDRKINPSASSSKNKEETS